jgi:hypothetical protein
MKKFTLLALAFLPIFSSAQEIRGNGLTYNYAGVGYGYLKFDSEGVTGNLGGVGVEGGALLSENIFVVATYAAVSANKFSVNGTSYAVNFDVDATAVDVGYRFPLSKGTDLNLTVGVARSNAKATVSGTSISSSDTSYPVGVAIRSALSDVVEVGANGAISDGTFGGGAFLQYKATTNVGLVGSYAKSKNVDGYTLSVRYLF